MVFFFVAMIFLYIGRKVGWALSRGVLYTASLPTLVLLCVVWGGAVALVVRFGIDAQQPQVVLRWIMGYALGAYVAIPNYGLVDKSTIPDEALVQDTLMTMVPLLTYIAGSIAMAVIPVRLA